jgi:hypothetical protein
MLIATQCYVVHGDIWKGSYPFPWLSWSRVPKEFWKLTSSLCMELCITLLITFAKSMLKIITSWLIYWIVLLQIFLFLSLYFVLHMMHRQIHRFSSTLYVYGFVLDFVYRSSCCLRAVQMCPKLSPLYKRLFRPVVRTLIFGWLCSSPLKFFMALLSPSRLRAS